MQRQRDRVSDYSRGSESGFTPSEQRKKVIYEKSRVIGETRREE